MPNVFRFRRLAATVACLAWLSFVAGVKATAQTGAPIVAPAAGGEPWSAASVTKLGVDVDALLANVPTLRGAHVAVLAVEAVSGRVLYARNADDAVQPASTLKLLVGSAALERLGPAYRFRTEASLQGGALVVRAGGDPTLSTADLAGIGAAFRGMPTDPATVRVDATHFDAQPYPAGWTWDDFGYDYAARVSAATLDENVATYGVAPGLSVGAPVRLLDGSVVLSPLGCGAGTVGVRSVATTAASGGTSTSIRERSRPTARKRSARYRPARRTRSRSPSRIPKRISRAPSRARSHRRRRRPQSTRPRRLRLRMPAGPCGCTNPRRSASCSARVLDPER